MTLTRNWVFVLWIRVASHFSGKQIAVIALKVEKKFCSTQKILICKLKKKIIENIFFLFSYSDDPLDKDLYHALLHEDKVCDVISKWETALREKGMGKFENNRVIRFVYQNRLFWRKNISSEVERERLLFAYQISKQIVQGKFPINKELAFELTALMAQVHTKKHQLLHFSHSQDKKFREIAQKYCTLLII